MTDEQKAVEEMANVAQTKFSCMTQSNFCDRFFQCKGCPHNKEYSESIATALIAAGYRKQSDTVKEFAEKLTKLISEHDYEVMCQGNRRDRGMFTNGILQATTEVAASFDGEGKL